MIFQDNIVKKYLQIHSKKYGILNNFYFYCKESFIYNKLGFILSLFLVPAGIIKSVASIFIPKLVIDSLESFRSEYTFLINIIIVTVVIAVSSIVELLVKNTMEHNMNSFVLIQLNKLWIEKVATMDYEVFTSELGKQSASKARMTLEGTTRWGIGTYIPRLLELLTSFIGFIIYGVMLIYVHPLVLAVLIAAYAVNMVVTLYAEKKKQMLKDDVAKAERKMNYFAYSTRGLSIAKDIRVYSMREWISQMAGMARLDKKKVDDKVQNYQLFVLIVNGIVVLLRDGLVYLILIWLTLKGDITIGSFALYAAAVNGLGEWLAQITTGVGAFRESDNNVTDFRQFLGLPDGKIGSEEKLELSGAPGIELDNVSFSYDKRKIIDDISLSIPQKTTTAIVGPSGGGKSTLCNLIARFWDVDSGEVTLGGVNVKDYSMNSLMRNFSFVFQSVYLFADTIENNIKFGRQDASHEEVVEAAKKACCHDFISKLPNGYDTVIGEGGATLSGGEKQRISIARAIMKDAPIVILDEATANVDPENEKELMDAVDALTKEKTIIMIAHRLKTVRHADQIVVVDKGRIVQQGTHEQLMKQEGIYKRFVDARQQAVSWKLAH